MDKKSRSGSGMLIPDPDLGFSRELRVNFLGYKYLNSFMLIRIRDPESFLTLDPASVSEHFVRQIFGIFLARQVPYLSSSQIVVLFIAF